MGNPLLVGLAKGLVGLLGLLLEQLEPAVEGLIRGRVLGAILGGLLEVADGGLELLNLALEQAVLVLEGGDLLLLGQVLLLEHLDLALELLDLDGGIVGLQAELGHFLHDGTQHLGGFGVTEMLLENWGCGGRWVVGRVWNGCVDRQSWVTRCCCCCSEVALFAVLPCSLVAVKLSLQWQ